VRSVAVLAIIAAATVSWLLWPRDPGPVAPPVVAQAGAPVHLEPNVSFTPRAAPTNRSYRSADGAWASWADHQHLPPGVNAQFGLLNDQGRHNLVWAYTESGCAAMVGYPRHFGPGHPPRCHAWTFLNPKSGRLIWASGGPKIG
jgi:hypothetical protein